MAIFEGPAPTGDELGAPPPAASHPPPSQAPQGLPEAPPLTPERARQELDKLAAIIESNESLNFLEPRVKRCIDSGDADLSMLLSFYRLVSQALSEELGSQKERLQVSQSALLQAKQTSAQAQMQAAFEEASAAVQMVARGEASGTAPAVGSAPAASEEVLARLEQSEKQNERLLQDMQNIRNRAKIDIEVRVFKELEKFCGSLLPALDGFHQAMPTLKTTTDIASVMTGVAMIYEQLQESLESAGLQRMKVVGAKFDPRYHEAIGEVPTDKFPDDHCFDELQPGYMLGERLLRAAMVRIARNDSPAPAASPAAAPSEAPQAAVSSPPQAAVSSPPPSAVSSPPPSAAAAPTNSAPTPAASPAPVAAPPAPPAPAAPTPPAETGAPPSAP